MSNELLEQLMDLSEKKGRIKLQLEQAEWGRGKGYWYGELQEIDLKIKQTKKLYLDSLSR